MASPSSIDAADNDALFIVGIVATTRSIHGHDHRADTTFHPQPTDDLACNRCGCNSDELSVDRGALSSAPTGRWPSTRRANPESIRLRSSAASTGRRG